VTVQTSLRGIAKNWIAEVNIKFPVRGPFGDWQSYCDGGSRMIV